MTWAVWPSREWPRWVLQALPTNTLRQAWERKQQLTLSPNPPKEGVRLAS